MSSRRPLIVALLAGLGIAVLGTYGCGGSGTDSAATMPGTPSTPPQVTSSNVLTYHNDLARTGQNLSETALTLGNVNSSQFGKLYSVAVDGKVDAQPLYVSGLTVGTQGTHSVIFAATEHDSVYAIDAGNGTVLWHVSLLGSGETPSDNRGCTQVTPEIGITATPAITLTAGSSGLMYLLTMTKDSAGDYHHRLHALDLSTGGEALAGPVEIAATVPGTGDNSSNGQVVFDPKQYKSRPAVLLLNGSVYIGFGSHCDFRPYTGWLMAYNQNTLQQTAVFNFAPNGNEAALWNSGGGFAADPSTGRLFASVANGTFDSGLDANGFPSSADYGNSFVKLNTVNNQLAVEDYWSMSNTFSESAQDIDLGSGGVLLMPNLTSTSGQTVQLGTGAGKDGMLYVFNRANMGKFNAQNNSTIYQALHVLNGGVFSSPAWFNSTLYYGAVSDHIRAFPVTAALVSSTPSSMSANTYGYPGTTPSISANGTSNGILWAVENAAPAVLHAYDAGNLANELYTSAQAANNRDSFGPGNKYITPTIAEGHVIVGTTDSIAVFGLLP